MNIKRIKDFLKWEILNRLQGKNISVVCICIMYEDKILTQSAQKNTILNTDDRQYVVPGGKVDKGESLSAAAHRETKEETNLNIDILKKLGKTRNNKYELHWFLTVPMDVSQLNVNEPLKQKELKWVDINDKSVNWTPGNIIAINKFNKQISNYKQYIR